MKVKIIVNAVGPLGSYKKNSVVEVTAKKGKYLIQIGFAEIIEEKETIEKAVLTVKKSTRKTTSKTKK